MSTQPPPNPESPNPESPNPESPNPESPNPEFPASEPAKFGGPKFSYGRFVAFTLGSGVLALLLSIPVILLLAMWHPTAGLIGAVLAIVVMIAVIGTVATRMLAKVEADYKAEVARAEGARLERKAQRAGYRQHGGPTHPDDPTGADQSWQRD